MAQIKVLADLNLAVGPPSVHIICAHAKFDRFKFGGRFPDRQTAKFKSPPIFPAIRYVISKRVTVACDE